MPQFKTGDQVYLATSLRPMTVCGPGSPGHVQCCWVDDQGRPQTDEFPEAVLVRAEDDDFADCVFTVGLT